MAVNKTLSCEIKNEKKSLIINLVCRLDTTRELDYYNSGGILQYILDDIIHKAS